MCGRYQFSATEYDDLGRIVRDAQRRAGQSELNFPMAGDIYPTATAPVLVARGNKIVAEMQKWGIRNQYKKTMINARAETVTERPMFARSMAAKRCVVPTTAFYEWDKRRHQYVFTLPGQPIYLAGIYDCIDEVNCFVILTTKPNESVSDIHDRMPLILSREQIRPWLTDAHAALELLATTPPQLQRVKMDGQIGFEDLQE